MILLEVTKAPKALSFVDLMGILGAFAGILTIPISLDQIRKLREKKGERKQKFEELALIAGALANQTDILKQKLTLSVQPILRINAVTYNESGDISIDLTNKGEYALINDFKFSGIQITSPLIPRNLDKGEQLNITGQVIDDKSKYEIAIGYCDVIRQKHLAVINGIGGEVKILLDEAIAETPTS